MPSAIDEAERISEPSRKQSRYGSKAMIEIDEMMPLASIAEAMPLIEHTIDVRSDQPFLNF